MMKTNRLVGPLMLLAGIGMAGCATTDGPDTLPAHDNADAVVWMQTSAEYAAVTTSIYAAAREALEKIAEAEPGRTRQMAIVLDVDETVLDNGRYQGQLVLDDSGYDSETWDDWIALRTASAVPGVVEFIGTAQALGFHVAFITNRSCRARPNTPDNCPQLQDTESNLQSVGIDTASTTLFLRGDGPTDRCRSFLSAAERVEGKWSSDKTSRRACIVLDYDIVMLFGDQLGDFAEIGDSQQGVSGRDIAATYPDRWGKTWFMLPNPTYGSWRPRDPAKKRDLIRGIN